VGSEWRATKLLHIRVGLRKKRVWFCNWFISHVHDGFLNSKLTFFTDGANFNLSGYINSQNNRYYPHALIKFPFFDLKIGRHVVCD
jgi:cbb3-type cytochrome oxidase subunit 1